ncbi:hypothetical protein [Methylomagnum ishizawai]|uniref:hypothetical protein n=1 Tax=Methylomagnum ishizawai TaxID=1760988 RepID=UPI001C33DFB8|nr:hypothetical protein [Methylomagnum ishizawai]BBL75046.1 hypothetical protein MishRS11D_21440 [Methylomagnum ishizawai]
MKICLLGNSHSAALKIAYDALDADSRKALDVTFFASRGGGLAKALEPQGKKLISTDELITSHIGYTSGGLTFIDPEAYDVFILHAFGTQYDYEILDANEEAYYSKEFLTDYCAELIGRRPNINLLSNLASITSKPIYLSQQPFQSELNANLKSKVKSSKVDPPDLGECLKRFLAKQDHKNVKLLLQPPETIVDKIFTLAEFSVDSERLDINDQISKKSDKHNVRDMHHMNSKYGRLVWLYFLQQVG